MVNKQSGALIACSTAAVLAWCSVLVSAPATRHLPLEAWEYKFVEISAMESLGAKNALEAVGKLRSDPAAHLRVEKVLHDRLNALGADGWEMIDMDRGTYWFKRRTR